MWRKEDGTSQPSPNISTGPATAMPVSGKVAACISQGIRIKGELSGSEDLFIDGQVDGKIVLNDSTLTVGPNAVVQAEVLAREVVVRGRFAGKVTGSQKIHIWNTARLEGDLKAERIAVEEGAELHGNMEVGKATAPTASVKKGEAKTKDRDEGKPSSDAAFAGAS